MFTIGSEKMNSLEQCLSNLADAIIKLSAGVKTLAESSRTQSETMALLHSRITKLEEKVKTLENEKEVKVRSPQEEYALHALGGHN
jgi:chromosome segregation ATPase